MEYDLNEVVANKNLHLRKEQKEKSPDCVIMVIQLNPDLPCPDLLGPSIYWASILPPQNKLNV